MPCNGRDIVTIENNECLEAKSLSCIHDILPEKYNSPYSQMQCRLSF